MSVELPRTGCGFRIPICRTGLIVIQFVLLAITTTGWVVTATRERPTEAPPVPIHVEGRDLSTPQDLSKHSSPTRAGGVRHVVVSIQVGGGNAAAGFVGPGSRVNVLATVRLNNKLCAFPLLVRRMLVVCVSTATDLRPHRACSQP